MKKSKKLMLGTIAAMGALAVGAGAVSTFAWYQASSQSKINSALYNGSAIGTTTTTIALDAVTIEFTIESISGVQLTNLDSTTLYKGMVSGQVNLETGVVTNGAVTTVALTDDEASSGNFIKAYTVTAAYATGTTADKIAALAGYEVSATLTAAGQAKLRADQSKTGADDSSHTLTVKFIAGGTIDVVGEKYVRIQAKETGATKVDLAADHSGDKLSIAALSNVTPTLTA